MNISKRLLKILDFVDVNDKVADIGADHGYLTQAMYNKGVTYLQVVENKIGPLNRAKQNLMDYNDIIYSLSDGISDLDSKIDTVTICGMGGLNIVEILNNNLKTAKGLKKIIMQPNSKVFELRTFLYENGFEIVDEEIVFDAGKYYEIVVAKFCNSQKKISYHELLFGPILLKKMSNLFVDYYKCVKNNIQLILNNNKTRDIADLVNKLNLINTHIRGVSDDNN